MKYFTKEQLKEIEDMGMVIHLATVVQSSFKRGTFVNDDNRLADLYEQATGETIKRNWGCKTCAFEAYKQIGQLYFDSKKYWEEEDKAGDEIVDMIKEMVSEPKPKTTKKTTNNKKKTITKKK